MFSIYSNFALVLKSFRASIKPKQKQLTKQKHDLNFSDQ